MDSERPLLTFFDYAIHGEVSMSNQSGANGSQDNKTVIDTSLTDDERRLLTLYREMSERDRRYIRRVVEVISTASS